MLLNTFLGAASNRAVGRPQPLGGGFYLGRKYCTAIAFALLFWSNPALAQSSSDDTPRPVVAPTPEAVDSPAPLPESSSDKQPQSSTIQDSSALGSSTEAKQTKRSLWIFPNYRAVSRRDR